MALNPWMFGWVLKTLIWGTDCFHCSLQNYAQWWVWIVGRLLWDCWAKKKKWSPALQYLEVFQVGTAMLGSKLHHSASSWNWCLINKDCFFLMFNEELMIVFIEIIKRQFLQGTLVHIDTQENIMLWFIVMKEFCKTSFF